MPLNKETIPNQSSRIGAPPPDAILGHTQLNILGEALSLCQGYIRCTIGSFYRAIMCVENYDLNIFWLVGWLVGWLVACRLSNAKSPVYTYTHAHAHTLSHTHTHIYIYIYIYIYRHPQTDCFVVSQLISVAWHVGRLKLGSKPVQLYVRLNIIPISEPRQLGNYKALSSSFRLFTFLPYRIPECSIHSKSFALC